LLFFVGTVVAHLLHEADLPRRLLMELTIATLIVVGAFAIFGLYYAFLIAGTGKAKGDTRRTWCMPLGHGDIAQQTEAGRELAPPDECPPPPANEHVRDSGEKPRFA
jgi:hypothetical protein